MLISDAGEQRYRSLGSLLADKGFANLRGLIATQRLLASQAEIGSSLELCGTIDDPIHGSHSLSLKKTRLNFTDGEKARLRAFLVDGRAGVGKTYLIRQLSSLKKKKILAPPLLHGESRGSRLVVLTQLLASTLQSLRADFTFDQVPILIRCGLPQVAIDGFDELVDSNGYVDAWVALRDFFSEINGKGVVLLAARDTFFDHVAFERKLAGLSHHESLSSVRIYPVTPAAARRYLLSKGWTEDRLSSEEGREILHDGSYALRPFFLRTLADYSGTKDWQEILS